MDYDIGIKLDQLKADNEEMKQLLYVMMRIFEKSSPSKYKEVIEEVKKGSEK